MFLENIGRTIGDIFGFNRKKREDQPVQPQPQQPQRPGATFGTGGSAPLRAPAAQPVRPSTVGQPIQTAQDYITRTGSPVPSGSMLSANPADRVAPGQPSDQQVKDALLRRVQQQAGGAPIQRAVNSASSFVNDNVVRPAVQDASKAYNTVAAPIAGATGVGMAFADKAFNGGKNYQDILNATKAQVDQNVKDSFVSQDVASGKATPVQFAGEIAKTGIHLAPYVLPGGGALPEKFGAKVAENIGNSVVKAGVGGLAKNVASSAVAAPTFAGLNALEQGIDSGFHSFDPGQAAAAGLQAGALTLGTGLAGDLVSGGGKAVVKRAQDIHSQPGFNPESGFIKTGPDKPKVALKSDGVTPAKNGIAQQVKQGLVDSDQVILDELRNVEKQTGQKGLVDKFMYNSNMQRASNATANVNLQTSENIQNAIGGLSKKDYKAFSDYANARTELGSAQPGTSLSKTPEELKTIIDNGQEAHGPRFDALNQHYKDLADYAHQNGLISSETLNRYKADNNYIRIQRDMGDLLPDSFGKGNSYSLGSTVLNQKRKGSSRDVLPAGETAANYTQQIYKEAAKNKTSTQLLDTLSQHGLAQKLDSAAAARHQNTSKLIRDGKTEYYKVSPDMKQAIDNINPYQMNAVMQILAAPGRVLRAGVTGLNPIFIARNLLKDQVGTAINSEQLARTHNPVSFFSGLFNATKDALGANHDPLYQDFLKHYGDTTSYDLTRNIKDTQQVINRIRGGKLVGVGQALKSPIRTAENVASITEKSTRFQNYRGAYKDAISKGLPPEQASERAAMAAWQNSVDFSRAGTWGRAINTVVPYWNPATQGVRQMARTLTKHPIKSSLTATALVGVPLAAATAWNLSSPDTAAIYDNIPEYEKENNLILVPPGTQQNQDGSYDVVKIPLAPGWKDAFMPIRRAMEAYAHDKPAEYGQMAQDILQTVSGPVSVQSPEAFGGSFLPQAAKPFVQQYANKDLFSGKTIVPDYINQATDAEGNPVPEAQKATTHSSGTARGIGSALGVSPIRVEKFVKDTAGTVGLQALNAVDSTLAGAGVIPKDQVGGQSIQEGLRKSFGSAQGIDNANKSEGAKHFDNVAKATASLNQNEKAAFTSLHPTTKNFLGEQVYEADSTYNPAARLDIYNRFPKVFEADKQLDKNNRDLGKPGNPLFDLNPAQVKKVLEKDNLPPGTKDPELSNLYKQEWYSDYAVKKSGFFKAIQDNQAKDLATARATGDTKKVDSITASMDKFSSSSNPYPTASSDVQNAMNSYSSLPKGNGSRSAWIKANPTAWSAMQNQFAKVDDWQNKQREKRGLEPTSGAQTTGSSTSRGGRGGKGSGLGKSNYAYAVSLKAGGEFKKPSVKNRKITPIKIASGKASKPTVALKKSNV